MDTVMTILFSVLLGNGMGSFGTATSFAVGSTPRSVAVGDFNGDGRPDLATANGGSSNVSVLLGNGMGSFGTATSFEVGSAPGSVAVGDFNGDGRPDLATANIGSSTVSVLLGNGTGSFGTATSFAVGLSPWSVAVGDFNADRIPTWQRQTVTTKPFQCYWEMARAALAQPLPLR
jgi:hypothetical protein